MHIQTLNSKKDKSNLYGYLRSPQGYGNECNLLAMPMNHKASVAYGLTFVETWLRRQPKWQAKDLLILFYEEMDYALGVREFLEAYYQQSGQEALTNRIEGRCGYIRQSFVFEFPEYEFNKFALYIDGVNAQYSDIDFYDTTQRALTKLDMKVELTPPHYFKQNPYLMQLNKWFTQNVRSLFIQGLDVATTTLLDFSTN